MSLKSRLQALRKDQPPVLKEVRRVPAKHEGEQGEMRILTSSIGEQLLLKHKSTWYKIPIVPVTKRDTTLIKTAYLTGKTKGVNQHKIRLNAHEIPYGSVVGVMFSLFGKDTAANNNDMWTVLSHRAVSSADNQINVYFSDEGHYIYIKEFGTYHRGKKFQAIIFYKG